MSLRGVLVLGGLAAMGAAILAVTPRLYTRLVTPEAYLWFGEYDIATSPIVVMVDNIPNVRYGERVEANPVTVAQWGLSLFSQGHTADALREADWMRLQQRVDGTWVYTFDYPIPWAGSTMHAPWVSALAQGQGIALLVRAWHSTGDRAYLEAARLALSSFFVPVEDGGVLRLWNGMPFYEEYAQPGQPTLVLNGFLFALLGVRDLAVATEDADAWRVWNEGEATAAALVPQYSISDDQSTYALAHLAGGPPPAPVSEDYADVHVRLTREFAKLTGKPIYWEVAHKWEQCMLAPEWRPIGQVIWFIRSPSTVIFFCAVWCVLAAVTVVRRQSYRRRRHTLQS